jgi:hypothetical protein
MAVPFIIFDQKDEDGSSPTTNWALKQFTEQSVSTQVK